jgi:hypothetical protein
MKADREIEDYRQLMTPPSKFEDGFSLSSMLGALFIGILMVPGSMYMNLLAGFGVGPAARWVTIILFIEVAKRAHQSLSNAQIFTFFYIAGAVMAMPFESLLYQQFFVRSAAVVGHGMSEMIPPWFSPNDPDTLASRNFFQLAWLPVLGMILFQFAISRLDNMILGYGLFKVASDIEKLPFPMAPVGAQGVLALAEDLDQKTREINSWRWRMFSIGGAIGLAFGFLYLGVPTLSDALFGRTIQIFPIPFADWTGRTQDVLPAVATGISFEMGGLILGMVLPFYAMVGAFAGLVITFIMNPLLYRGGMLPTWTPGDGTVETLFKNQVDFYFSFGLGVSLAIAALGIFSTVQGLRRIRQHRGDPQGVMTPPGRGDIPTRIVLGVYMGSTLLYIAVCGWLIGWHSGVMTVLFIYGFLYTPFVSFVTARLEGMVGQALTIPLVREAGLILSGYKGIAVWFLPIPMNNYGVQTVFYREAELTGTKFTSIWKSELFLVPLIIVISIFFAQFIWSMGEIPSSSYPYAEKMWELQAKNQVLLYSSTADGYSQFHEAFKPWLVAIGLGSGLGLYGVLSVLGAPVMLLYGAVQGLNQTMPHTLVPMFLGAMLGRFVFERRIGKDWRKFTPVISAGYFCGFGLISLFCIGVKFLTRSVSELPY